MRRRDPAGERVRAAGTYVAPGRRPARRVRTAVERGAVWCLLRVLPSRPHAVVHGWPDSEGSAVEVVRALARRYPGRVCWLLDDPTYEGPLVARAELAGAPDLRRLPKRSLPAVWACLTAELTLFTHGLFTAVRPPSDRLVVNLWHGDGPKRTADVHRVRSTVVVAGSRLWGSRRPALFGVPPDALALTGNPRTDQLSEPASPQQLRSLGLDPERGRVLWMPTYRRASGPRGRTWTDAPGLSDDGRARATARALALEASRHGLELVVKPHPLDADDYGGLGAVLVDDASLRNAGVGLYQLMGACSALVSDLSSAWVDYLVLDRPVGFLLGDLERFRQVRGVNVDDLDDLLPGLRLDGPQDAAAFARGVAAGSAALRPSAWPGTATIGPVQAQSRADDLLDWLDAFRADRGRPPLFRPGPRRGPAVRPLDG